MNQIQILTRETLSRETYPLEQITFTRPGLDGKLHQQQNEVYFRPDAVAVLLVDSEKQEFLLARQIRLPVFLNQGGSGSLLETCAGLIEPGESPQAAAKREVSEELGYEVSDLLSAGGMFSSAGGLTEYVNLFITYVNDQMKTGEPGGAAGEGEDIQLETLSFPAAAAMLRNLEIQDAKTRVLLQHFFLHLKEQI